MSAHLDQRSRHDPHHVVKKAFSRNENRDFLTFAVGCGIPDDSDLVYGADSGFYLSA